MINSLAEFSRTYCIAICTALVPANLLATSLTLLSVYRQRSPRQIQIAALFAILMASLLFAHVSTWLVIGVVKIPTFILFGLSLLCLLVNLPVLTHFQRFEQFFQKTKKKLLSFAIEIS